jgi:hypothetical protein
MLLTLARGFATSSQFNVCTTSTASASVHNTVKILHGFLLKICPDIVFEVVNIDLDHTEQSPTNNQTCLGVGTEAASILGFEYPPLVNKRDITESFALGKAQQGRGYVLTSYPEDTSYNQRGTLYAALDFAERLGLRFLDSNTTVSTKKCPWRKNSSTYFAMLPVRYSFTPSLLYRQVFAWDVNEHSDFAERERTNSRGAVELEPGITPPPLSAGGVIYATPPGMVHTSYTLLTDSLPDRNAPPPDLFYSHNEWFWPRIHEDPNGTAYGIVYSTIVQTFTSSITMIHHDSP